MAGEGSRFQKEGYTRPKPLIDVLGKPMILRALEDLPESQEHIFLCRQEHLEKFNLKDLLIDFDPGAKIISVADLTDGQASTCLLAKHFVNNDKELLIAACDNGMQFSRAGFDQLRAKGVDAIIFTFRNNVAVKSNPDQYGWIVNEANKVIDISIKKSLSSNPMNDHAISGTFWFRKGRLFVEGAERMISEDRRINGEFYVDEMIRDLLLAGLDVRILEVEHYLGWGTPDDLRTYEYWESFFRILPEHPYGRQYKN